MGFRKINIEFTRPKQDRFAFFSKLIRLFQKTKYSHVRLHWTNSTGRDVVYEASGSKIHFLGELAQPTKPVEVLHLFTVPLNNEEYRALIDLCMKYAGLKYGVWQSIGIGLSIFLKLKKNPFSDGYRSQVCSELVGRFLEEVLELPINIDLDIAGPKEIYLILEDAVKADLSGIQQVF